VSIRLLNCQTRNLSKSCISRSTSQSHSLSDSISQCASLFTYHLVRAGYSPAPSSRFTLTTPKTLVNSPTDYVSSGLGSARRTDTYAELATEPNQLTSSRTCHRHVTFEVLSMLKIFFGVGSSCNPNPILFANAGCMKLSVAPESTSAFLSAMK
jgi:hypothetical protein